MALSSHLLIGNLAKWLKCLPSKHKIVSLISCTKKKIRLLSVFLGILVTAIKFLCGDSIPGLSVDLILSSGFLLV